MVAFLGPLLGGLAGILFPGLAAGAGAAAAGGAAATGIGALLSKAMLPALGAGLGTLVTGGNGKDAIRNALLMGGATALFPGAVSGIQQSGFGKGITGGLADLLGIGGGGPEASTSTAPAAVPPPITRPPEDSRRFDGFGSLPGPAGGPPTTSSIPSIYEMSGPAGGPPPNRSLQSISQMVGPAGGPPPLDASLSAAMGELGMGRPEGLTVPPGMTSAEGMANLARDRYLATELLSPESLRAGADLALATRTMRSPMLGVLPSYAQGGEIEGPGNGTSDSVPAMIYQGGKPVSKAALSDGEFVMTARAVKGAGNGSRDRGISRMYELMRRFERGEMA